MLIKLCKIPHKNLDKTLLFSKNQVFYLKNEKFDELQRPESSMFSAETSHMFPTYQCLQKGVRDFFYFVQILSYLQNLKGPGYYTLVFYAFINSSRSKQNKKNSAKNIKLYGSWSSSKFSTFRQKTCFLEVIEVCINLGIGFCITLLVVLPNYKKISLQKPILN